MTTKESVQDQIDEAQRKRDKQLEYAKADYVRRCEKIQVEFEQKVMRLAVKVKSNA